MENQNYYCLQARNSRIILDILFVWINILVGSEKSSWPINLCTSREMVPLMAPLKRNAYLCNPNKTFSGSCVVLPYFIATEKSEMLIQSISVFWIHLHMFYVWTYKIWKWSWRSECVIQAQKMEPHLPTWSVMFQSPACFLRDFHIIPSNII